MLVGRFAAVCLSTNAKLASVIVPGFPLGYCAIVIFGRRVPGSYRACAKTG